MPTDQQRVVDWLDDVLAWLREPLTEMPVDRVMGRLRLAFDIVGSSWIEQRGLLMTQMVHDPPGILDAYATLVAEFMAGGYRDRHPLTVWYENAGADPQTSERVPSGLVSRARRAMLVDPLVPLGAEQQMTIYYQRDCSAARFFVIARGGSDFDDDDLLMADYVQRSLVTLYRQTQVLHASEPAADRHRADIGLTGRELAVLQLLSDGLSSRQAARRLACSPRTVEKHLQHTYRKLEVSDRVNAIRVARLAGVVVEAPDPAVVRAPASM